MARKTPVAKRIIVAPSDFDEFIEWSRKKKFGIIYADESKLKELGLEGDLLSRRLFEISQKYETFRYPDYSYLLESTSRLIASESVDAFFNLPLRIQPDILEILRFRGSQNIKGYLEALKLAKYPKPYILEGHNKLKPLMLATQGLAGRNTAAKITEEFKLTVNKFALNSRPSVNQVALTTIFILYTIYGERPLLDIFTKIEKEDKILATFEIIKLIQDWENLKEYPLEWSTPNLL